MIDSNLMLTHKCRGHSESHTHAVLLTNQHNNYSPSPPLSYGSKDRGQLSEATVTCHQGHLQWVITLDPGPKLQRLKIHALFPPSPTQATRGIRIEGPGSHSLQSKTKAESLPTGKGISLGWMEGRQL